MSKIISEVYYWLVRNKRGTVKGRGKTHNKREARRDANRAAKLLGVGATREVRADERDGGAVNQGIVELSPRGRLVVRELET